MNFTDAWKTTKQLGIGPILQSYIELEKLFDIIREMQCRSLLEIGSRVGGSLYVLGHAIEAGGTVVSVDRYEREGDVIGIKRVIGQLTKGGYQAQSIVGDSHDMQIVMAVRALEPFDAVFIDGDHTLDGIESDWLDYGIHAMKLCAFHDIASKAGTENEQDAPEHWRKFKRGRATHEFKDPELNYGIGVVIMAHP